MDTKEESEQGTHEQAALFSALADPTRLRLVKLLCRQSSPDALCVNALAARLGVTQSAVSQHLRVLKAIGLVNGERRGYHIHYFINRERLESCREIVSATLSMGESGKAQRCQDDCPDRRKQDVSSD
ncbi:MAG: metalloregulator ArsR/SmtB family transcription factor [Chloroflexi bacterium]|nr:metalloregulator ArsR/SmtB family transcription factor [Chloroflexota bacterium]